MLPSCRWLDLAVRKSLSVNTFCVLPSWQTASVWCVDEIREQVRRDIGLSVTDAQIEGVLSEKACSMEETTLKEELETTLRRVLREELKAVPFQPVPQQEESILQEMMEFLGSLLGDE